MAYVNNSKAGLSEADTTFLVENALQDFQPTFAQVIYPVENGDLDNRRSFRTALHLNQIHRLDRSVFSFTTVSGTGSGTGSSVGLTFYQLINSGATAVLRATYGSGSFFNPFSDTEDTIDWTKSWVFRFRACIKMGSGSSTRQTLFVGGVTNPTTDTLTAGSKGVAIYWKGTGSACTVEVASCDATNPVSSSSTTSHTANTTVYSDYALVYWAGTSLRLFKNGVLQCSKTNNLPTGNGTAGVTGPYFIAKATADANNLKQHFADMEIIRESQ